MAAWLRCGRIQCFSVLVLEPTCKDVIRRGDILVADGLAPFMVRMWTKEAALTAGILASLSLYAFLCCNHSPNVSSHVQAIFIDSAKKGSMMLMVRAIILFLLGFVFEQFEEDL